MKKHFKYASYVARHKWFVLLGGLKTKAPFWRLFIHDYTKLMPVEWVPYVNYFYGGNKPGREAKGSYDAAQTGDAAFDRAWLHHQHRNPHHWQHWTLQRDDGTIRTLPMPENFVREMVADWMGAGRAITGKWETSSWYAANKDKMRLDPGTRARVEQLLATVSQVAEGGSDGN